MKVKLRDGRVVEIVPLSSKIPTKRLLEYINGIIEEDGYLQYDEKFTLPQRAAIGLYRKLGFEEFVRYPKWWLCRGKKADIYGMILKK
jgi:hypothetical protein